jgi:hypothetical protein
LIDGNEFVEMLKPLDAIMRARFADAGVQIAIQRLGENIVHERTFSRTAHAGDTH